MTSAETSARTPEQTVAEFLRLVVARDLDAACALVAPDVEYDNVPVGKTHGPDGLRSILGGLLSGAQEVEWVTHRQVAAGNVVMNERTDRFLINGSWLELPVAGVFEVDAEGRLALWRDYFDMTTFTNEMARVSG